MAEILVLPEDCVNLGSEQDSVSIEVINNEVQIVVEVTATEPQGPPGSPPTIGENGNWWIGCNDTGVPASGGGVAIETITNEELEEMLQ